MAGETPRLPDERGETPLDRATRVLVNLGAVVIAAASVALVIAVIIHEFF
jgi:hypothetical protein